MGSRHIAEHRTARGRWNIIRSILGTQQEDSHFSTGDKAVGAEVAVAAAGGNPVIGKIVDPILRPMVGSIPELSGDVWRRVVGAIDAAFKEDRHLGACDRSLGAIDQEICAAAAGGPIWVEDVGPAL